MTYSSDRNHIDNIPAEMTAEILNFLNALDQSTLAQVSRKYSYFVQDATKQWLRKLTIAQIEDLVTYASKIVKKQGRKELEERAIAIIEKIENNQKPKKTIKTMTIEEERKLMNNK